MQLTYFLVHRIYIYMCIYIRLLHKVHSLVLQVCKSNNLVFCFPVHKWLLWNKSWTGLAYRNVVSYWIQPNSYKFFILQFKLLNSKAGIPSSFFSVWWIQKKTKECNIKPKLCRAGTKLVHGSTTCKHLQISQLPELFLHGNKRQWLWQTTVKMFTSKPTALSGNLEKTMCNSEIEIQFGSSWFATDQGKNQNIKLRRKCP